MELWKDIKGYEGLYQVSTKGNVRSLNWRNHGFVKNLYLKKQNRGYLQVELAKNGKTKMFMVHRLVAEAFLKNPEDYPCVNHLNEEKQDNRVENLEWCSASTNVKYSLEKHRDRVTNRRYHTSHCRLTKPILQIKDGTVVRRWDNSRQIFKETGMSDWSISECCRGNRKHAYGYDWQYAN